MPPVADEDPPPLSVHWPEIPNALECVIMRCLERNRDQRYPSIDQLLQDLERLRA